MTQPHAPAPADTSPETPAKTPDKAVVAILGASPNTQRYAWQAQQLLKQHHYQVAPVSARYESVNGVPAVQSFSGIPEKIHTITVYLSPEHLTPYIEQMIDAKPQRVIFNPGSEHPQAIQQLTNAGIEVETACTLVMLRSGQF